MLYYYQGGANMVRPSQKEKIVQALADYIESHTITYPLFDIEELHKLARRSPEDDLSDVALHMFKTVLGFKEKLNKEDALDILQDYVIKRWGKNNSYFFTKFHTRRYPYRMSIGIITCVPKNPKGKDTLEDDQYELNKQLDRTYDYRAEGRFVKGFNSREELLNFFVNQVECLQVFRENNDIYGHIILQDATDNNNTKLHYKLSALSSYGETVPEYGRRSVLITLANGKEPAQVTVAMDNVYDILESLNNNTQYLKEFTNNYMDAFHRMVDMLNPKDIIITDLIEGNIKAYPSATEVPILINDAIQQTSELISDKFKLSIDSFLQSKQKQENQDQVQGINM